MAEPDDLSAVFDIPDLWKTSKWHAQLNDDLDGPNPFFSPSLKKDLDSDLVRLSSIAVEKNGFFQLPSLRPEPEEAEPEVTTSSNDVPTPKETIHNAEPTDDLWMDIDEPKTKVAEHKTWDGFIAGRSTVGQPHMVTEAGAGVYDALLTWSMDPLELKNSDIPIIDAKAYFTSLLALALGQESVFFLRPDKGRSLAPALPSMRVSGYSRDVLEGLEKQCHKCGLMFLELQSFVQTTYSKRTNRCGVALAGALDQVLKDVQQHVAVSGQNPRSLLELQSTVKGLLAILAPFRRLTSKFRKGYTDEHVLSYVFHEAYSVDYGEEQLRGTMREVLQRVSQPWIEFLEEWIGTRREEGLPLTKANVGESKGFIKVDKEKYMDDFGQEVEDVDFRLDENKMPHFMPYDIAKSIFETGKNLRFIRTCHPEHPLATPNILDVTRPPKVGWLYDWDAIHELEARVNEYRANLFEAVQKARTHQEPDQHEEQDLLKRYMLPLASGAELQYHGIEADQMEQRLLASIEQFNQPLPDHGAEDSLSQVVRQRLSGAYRPPAQRPDFAPHWSLLPVLSFGGIASAQSYVVNQESLRLLFSDHDLRSHLKMHRDFHMFGNGLFVSRLSHALFDPELETAERQAGVARQGGVMGLRLGGRDTWPPASSELRLALMGVLAESFASDNGFSKERLTSISRDSAELPGDLSFGVRDLSEEEIEKCMNPDSLEALDFLRLSYKAPGPLSSIITPVILTQYDRIFKFLLRILRMLYVINQLFRDVNSRTTHWYDPEDISYRFAREAHHFVSGITSFFFDSGIAIPWQAFEAKLDKIESDLNNPDLSSTPETVESPDRLREFHSRVLDWIMLSLFLRKRQQPVLKLLDEIFVSLLAYSKFSRMKAMGIGPDTSPEETRDEIRRLYKNFKTKVQIFATVCRALTEKSRSTSNKVSDDLGLKQEGIGEDHMVAQLLMKLEMNEYYTKG